MKHLSPWRLATVLLVLLAMGSVVLIFGQEEPETRPSVTNTRSSGLAAFAELLRQDGYRVVLDRERAPALQPGDVAVAAQIGGLELDSPSRGDAEDGLARPTGPRIWDSLALFAANGGRVLTLQFPFVFRMVPRTGPMEVVTLPSDTGPPARFKVLPPGGERASPLLTEGRATYDMGGPMWPDMVSAQRSGSGMVVTVRNGAAFSNRFLGLDENAAYALALVRRVAPAGSRIVFTEASFGNAVDKGLLGTIGSWAVAAQWQFVLLGVVIVFSLGRRLGEPERPVEVQRGTRELFDAVGETLRRSRQHDYALASLCRDTLDRARSLLRLSPSTPEAEVLRLLPPGFQAAYQRARTLTEVGGTRQTALAAARDLDIQRRALESDHRIRRTAEPSNPGGGRS